MHAWSIPGLLLACVGCRAAEGAPPPPRSDAPPSVLLVVTDDQGYGDLSCAGHPTARTPHLDALAARGTRCSQFYVASSVCTPSRAALLTGCMPVRVGLARRVVFPEDDHGLHPSEVTLAEILRARGYATGCFGKWHLGHRRGLLPTSQGFDVFEGLPYSNDMSQWDRPVDGPYRFRLPWMRGEEVVEWEPDQRQLTERTTRAALEFVEQHAEGPFLAYVAYSMPHVPLSASEAFAGRTPRGLYGDVLEELDAAVGRLVAAVERAGAAERTLVLFTSDNGPNLGAGEAGGSAGPLRGGKATVWEGGFRVPFVACWPGHVPAGRVVTEVVTALDLLPTVAAWCGASAPTDRALDGYDVRDVLCGDAASPTRDFLYYSRDGEPAAYRRGPWKLHLATDELYQVERDVSEARDVAARHPELVLELHAAALARADQLAREARPAAHVARRVFDPLGGDA